jgi:hypothetical protein
MARPKGSKNKTGAEVKAQILAAYERLGALQAFTDWAKENRTEFYKMYARLAPTELIADVVHHDASALTDEQLASIASGSSDGTAEPENGETVDSSVH